MFRKLTILLSIFTIISTNAQVSVNNNQTVAWYVQNVLLGQNVSVSNISYNGSTAQAATVQGEIGEFSNPGMQIGLASGFVMGSGDATIATLSNTSSGYSSGGSGFDGGDTELQSITGSNDFYDKCIIEFDFVPTGDTLSFNYIFASEEYEEYVCSQYNDVFGFFLSGANPSGGNYTNFNVARVPTSLTPPTFSTVPVTINTVNQGSVGTFGTSSNCSSLDPNWQSNSVYYVSNVSGSDYEFDGRTVALPVSVPVVCGDTYHIKLAVADIGDGAYDSGVFLEAGSFSSNGVNAQDAITPGDVVLCTNDLTMNFSAGPNPPPYSYWDFGDNSGTSTLANPTYTYADTGYYQVMFVATDSSGSCIVSDTAYFDVNLSFPEQFNAQLNVPTIDPCTDTLQVHFEFTGTGADSLIWNMGNGDIYYDSTAFDYDYTTQGNYIVSMIAFDLDCNYTDTITDTINFISNFTNISAIPPTDTTLCSPPPFNYTFNAGSNPPPNVFWNFGDLTTTSDTSSLFNPTYTYADTGSYVVMFVAIDSSSCNIADTAYFDVQMNQAEQFDAQFNLPPVDPCSAPDSLLVQLAFTGTGADSILWDLGNGTTFTNVDSVNYYYTSQGTYVITMTAWDLVCNHTDSISDTLAYLINYTNVNANQPPNQFFCDPPFVVDFSAGNNPPPDNYWIFGDGSGTSTLPDPTYTYSDTGTYVVTYYAIDSTTCNIIDSTQFTVQLTQAETFAATLDFTPPPPCGSEYAIVNLEFTGSGADSLIWDMGNGDVYTNIDSLTYIYTDPGTYNVSMTAYDLQCNKVQTISNQVVFTGTVETEAIIPNIFTPNGDLVNDELKFINIDETKDYSLRIFDRWGIKVFETTDPMNYWDGTNKNGKDMNEGVYYYEIIYTDKCKDESNVKTGPVQLVR